MVVEVVVDRKTLSVNKPYDYLIDPKLEGFIQVGMRVLVNFHGKNLIGYIVNIKETSDFPTLKIIYEVLDVVPCLTEELLYLAYHMHKYYFCLYIKTLELMIPQALRAKYSTNVIKLSNDLDYNINNLFNNRDEFVLTKTHNPYLKEIIKLSKDGKILLEQVVSNKGNIKEKSILRLNTYDIKLTAKQLEIVDYFNNKEYVDKKELQDIFSVSRVSLLINKNVLIEEKEEVYRLKNKKYEDKVVTLNKEQLDACNKITLNKYDTYLLHGITGSGKTEIYLNMIEQVVKEGKEAILLVPEISLTPQMIERITGRFGSTVALYHSGLSIGEKYDEYRKILNKEVKIVVGARSAIFVPFTNIGIIIIDEEHDSSYIQDTDPRYDARIIARIRGKKHNAPVVLGSATPDICSYYKSQKDIYKLIELKNRANKQELPNLKIVDMANELKKGNRDILSIDLKNKIRDRLTKDEQTIILLNRRGFSSYIICRDCDETIKCPHCDVNLTYHKNNDTLRCHHCGFSRKNIQACESCNSTNLKYLGVGTQQVVETLERLFPNELILRMDVDTTSKKNSHEEILTKFRNKESKILVGTQMIAKGLDFPYVTLVGILNADISLKSSNYDANEKCYQLITQVAGRAGRHHLGGEVIVQAFQVDSYAITMAKNNNYLEFYNRDLCLRKLSSNPPFYDLITITVVSKYQSAALKFSNQVKNYLIETNAKVIGPAEEEIFYIADQYRYKITVKFNSDIKIGNHLENIYLRTLNDSNVSIYINRY